MISKGFLEVLRSLPKCIFALNFGPRMLKTMRLL